MGIYPQDSRGGGEITPITPLMAATVQLFRRLLDNGQTNKQVKYIECEPENSGIGGRLLYLIYDFK